MKRDDIAPTLSFIILGALILRFLSTVPYAGPFLGLACGLGLGWLLGIITLPLMSRVLILVCSMGGYFFGLKHHARYVQGWEIWATIVCAVFFIYASFIARRVFKDSLGS